jgi:hypothetical protein
MSTPGISSRRDVQRLQIGAFLLKIVEPSAKPGHFIQREEPRSLWLSDFFAAVVSFRETIPLRAAKLKRLKGHGPCAGSVSVGARRTAITERCRPVYPCCKILSAIRRFWRSKRVEPEDAA